MPAYKGFFKKFSLCLLKEKLDLFLVSHYSDVILKDCMVNNIFLLKIAWNTGSLSISL
jgi:hypothetical protein